MYLMIQNPGVAPVEAFTIFGVSTTRDAVNDRFDEEDNDFDLLIGTFGSGCKHSVNLLLRNNISTTVFCGKMRLGFYVEPAMVDDGLVRKNYGKVRCKMSGSTLDGRTIKQDKDLSFSLDYGTQDWNDTAMALREFVSNAIDRTIREEGKFLPAIHAKRLSVQVVDDNQVRAKDGYTRIFVPLTPEVQKFYMELPKRFLHFSDPALIRQVILRKKDRSIGENNYSSGRKAINTIYRRGVFVREVASSSAQMGLFDYNFNNELELDEARNVDDYKVASAAARAIRAADVNTLRCIFDSILRNEESWESELESYSLKTSGLYNDELKARYDANWEEAWRMASDCSVLYEKSLVGNNYLAERARNKGIKILGLNTSSFTLAALQNIKNNIYNVLQGDELKEEDIVPTTIYAQEAVDTVWGWIEETDLTNGKEKPPVICFKQLPDASSETFGYYENGKVYINVIHSNNGVNDRLLQTALDELTHHITGSTDASRDFQSFLMRMVIAKFKGATHVCEC